MSQNSMKSTKMSPNVSGNVILEVPEVPETVANNFPCNYEDCSCTFSLKRSLRRHQRQKHNLKSDLTARRFVCPLCFVAQQTRAVYIDHLRENHQQELVENVMMFDSFEDFEQWKLALEKETKASYKFVGKKDGDNGFILYTYYCNRSGTYKKSPGTTRAAKYQGTIRTGAFCPASIRLRYNTLSGGFSALFIPTHLGHELDDRFLGKKLRSADFKPPPRKYKPKNSKTRPGNSKSIGMDVTSMEHDYFDVKDDKNQRKTKKKNNPNQSEEEEEPAVSSQLHYILDVDPGNFQDEVVIEDPQVIHHQMDSIAEQMQLLQESMRAYKQIHDSCDSQGLVETNQSLLNVLQQTKNFYDQAILGHLIQQQLN